jgi:hypothetical protein
MVPSPHIRRSQYMGPAFGGLHLATAMYTLLLGTKWILTDVEPLDTEGHSGTHFE